VFLHPVNLESSVKETASLKVAYAVADRKLLPNPRFIPDFKNVAGVHDPPVPSW
jgi:RNase adaptor protein for sRNA GlmZ degradation